MERYCIDQIPGNNQFSKDNCYQECHFRHSRVLKFEFFCLDAIHGSAEGNRLFLVINSAPSSPPPLCKEALVTGLLGIWLVVIKRIKVEFNVRQ